MSKSVSSSPAKPGAKALKSNFPAKQEDGLSDFSTDDHVSGGPIPQTAQKIDKLRGKIREIESANPSLSKFASSTKTLTLDDAIDLLGGSHGRFQVFQAILFALVFAVGSQFFHSAPFFFKKPALRCFDQAGLPVFDKDGGPYCSREIACDKQMTQQFEIDWENEHTLNNWYLQLDLVCEPKYKIGMLSTISSIAQALGGALFTNQIDKIGRRPVVLMFGAATPLGLLLAQYFADSLLNLQIIMFLIALTYSTRASVAFMYGGEFLRRDQRMLMGFYTFSLTGCIYGLTAMWFWWSRDQRSFLWIMFAVTASTVVLIYALVPESPVFLYEMRRYSKLRECFVQIATFNGVERPEVVARYCELRLKLAALGDKAKSSKENAEGVQKATDSVFHNAVHRGNLFALCLLKSMAGFAFNLLITYSTSAPGNFYMNYSISGLSDTISMFYVAAIAKYYQTVRSQVSVMLWMLVLQTILMIIVVQTGLVDPQMQLWLIPVLLLMIRLNTGGIQNYGYHLNQVLFPVRMRGQSYGITNFVSRPLASVANTVIEYTDYPLLYVLGLALLTTKGISQIQEEEEDESTVETSQEPEEAKKEK